MTLLNSLTTALASGLKPPQDLSAYQTADGIVAFVQDVLHVPHPAPYQVEILRALVDHHRVAARAPHGAGKSTVASWIILWAVSVFDVDVKVVTTAGAWRQLKEFLWPEVRKWAARADWGKLGLDVRRGKELLDLSLSIGAEGAERKAFAVASDNPALIEGAHASVVVYVFDESKAIGRATWDAAEGAFSTGQAFALAISTPGEPAGQFYDIHARKPGYEDWWVKHITLEECLAAGRINPAWVEQRKKQWGETSAVYQNRVLGEFADSGEDSVVPLRWIELANERWYAVDGKGQGQTAYGADIARFGSDKTDLARKVGHVVEAIQESAKQDLMETAGQIVAFVGGSKTVPVAVDVIGIGAGVYDRLREQGYQVIPVNVSERSLAVDEAGVGYFNLRSELWWLMRLALDPQRGICLALPPDDELTGDLAAPTWTLTSEGKRKVESKDEIRKRLGRSTDKADSAILAYYAALLGGGLLIDWIDAPDEQPGLEAQAALVAAQDGVLIEADDQLLEGDDPALWQDFSGGKFRW